MTTQCEQCGATLRQYRFFRNCCLVCGSRYRAAPQRGLSWQAGIYGAMSALVLPAGLFVPGPLWLGLFVIPVAYIALGILLSLTLQRWVRIDTW